MSIEGFSILFVVLVMVGVVVHSEWASRRLVKRLGRRTEAEKDAEHERQAVLARRIFTRRCLLSRRRR